MIRSRIQWAMILLILLIAGGVAVVFTGNRMYDADESSILSSFKSGADMSIRTIRQTATRNGEIEWELKAESASLTQAGASAEIADPSITFYMKESEPLLITARTGTVQTDKRDISVSGDVRLTAEAYQLETETLRYQYDQQRFDADAPVTITGENLRLSADSASLDMAAGRAVLNGNVQGVIDENFSL